MDTEPDDQTAWFYHRWLVTWGGSLAGTDAAAASSWAEHLQAQLAEMEQLHEVEPASKCTYGATHAASSFAQGKCSFTGPIHAMAFLRQTIASQSTSDGDSAAQQPSAADYVQLAEMDPWHAGFYQHAAAATTGRFFGLKPKASRSHSDSESQ